MVNVLVLNAGSSSLRFQVFEAEPGGEPLERRLARGRIERIGSLALLDLAREDGERRRTEEALSDHQAAIDRVLRWLFSSEGPLDSAAEIGAVGHRVVHGGQRFRESVRIDQEVLDGIEDAVELAPLHNPANLRAIRATTTLLGGGVPQVAVFDTAFHATMPESSFLYGVPYHLYRRFKVRRYGFHGTSHRYVSERYRRLVDGEPDELDLITLHLGNGCSACAIRGGRSFDTSMGFTPLEGLLMGTRCGDVDPSLVEFLAMKEGSSLAEIDALLNKQSGLLGISGLTGDMRDLLEEERENGDRRARLAIDVFCYRVRKYIGAYYAALGGAEAVVFAGGIGENSPAIRARCCTGLESLGLVLDPGRNERLSPGEEGRISTDASRLAAWVVPTDEERMIARDVVTLLGL